MIRLGMHTDNWRHLDKDFEFAARRIAELGLKHIEFAVIDGQDFIEGLGFSPAIPATVNEIRLRRFLDSLGLAVSQIDGAYPLNGPLGANYGIQYVQKAIKVARSIGCPYVVTTDGARRVPGWSDEDIIRMWKQNVRICLEMAEDYGVVLNIEPHGPYTNDPEVLLDVLGTFESEHLRVNFDTGNTYIAGHEPLAFLKEVRKYLAHMHLKDVPQALADAERGEATGIASSVAAIGSGANGENIHACLRFLKETGWDGVCSIELMAVEGPLQQSVEWLKKEIA
ncbi:MAG: sugar phosphate isomerase/epimerase [Planctomycetes bacterium]|nr:sugar phosphate isomerase/epimerase [Planctomycetota bacterium]